MDRNEGRCFSNKYKYKTNYYTLPHLQATTPQQLTTACMKNFMVWVKKMIGFSNNVLYTYLYTWAMEQCFMSKQLKSAVTTGN